MWHTIWNHRICDQYEINNINKEHTTNTLTILKKGIQDSSCTYGWTIWTITWSTGRDEDQPKYCLQWRACPWNRMIHSNGKGKNKITVLRSSIQIPAMTVNHRAGLLVSILVEFIHIQERNIPIQEPTSNCYRTGDWLQTLQTGIWWVRANPQRTRQQHESTNNWGTGAQTHR